MQEVRTFLESSTIHGVAYISTTRKYVRLFWIVVVISGFIGAGVIIDQAFQSWDESPVKTTIETLPITEVTLPKVTVCPPRNTFTDLNYDLMMNENLTLDNDIRNALIDYSMDLLYEHLYDAVFTKEHKYKSNDSDIHNGKTKKALLYDDFYESIMTNLTMFEDNNRYFNWYKGFTKIQLPRFGDDDVHGDTVYYHIHTTASSGNISAKSFGNNSEENIGTNSLHSLIYPPDNVKSNPGVTLHMKIEKSSGEDEFIAENWKNMIISGLGNIDENASYIGKNFTPPKEHYYFMEVTRIASTKKVKQMPGFHFSWYYSGIQLQPEAKYINDFVR